MRRSLLTLALCGGCLLWAAASQAQEAPPSLPPQSATPAPLTPAPPAAAPPSTPAPEAPPARPMTEVLQEEARALEPVVKSAWVKEWLAATSTLSPVGTRFLWRDDATRDYFTPAEYAARPPEQRKGLKKIRIEESFYFTTKYGSPLAYARPLEILAERGLTDVAGKKILDFGCGGVIHLRLLAALGAEAIGVDVDPVLRALFTEPGDTGPVQGSGGREGRSTLVTGRFPSDPAVAAAVGEGYDLILSKNTLKRGYVHPEQSVDSRFLIDLGVPDPDFVATLFRILKPGGRVLIYNLSPAQAGTSYIPSADGRCPFPRAVWETAGFKVVTLDWDDGEAARALGRALGWDKGDAPMDLAKNLFARYSLLEKPATVSAPAP